MESDGKLPFLDVLLQQDPDGSISMTVYRKATHMDHYLDFMSHHPLAHKTCSRQETARQGRSNLLRRDCKGPGDQAHQTGPYQLWVTQRSAASRYTSPHETCRRAFTGSSGHPSICARSVRSSAVSPDSTGIEGLFPSQHHPQTTTSETKGSDLHMQ